MHDFTLKAFYTHTIPSNNTEYKVQWVNTIRIYACDQIAVMDCGGETIVSAFTNSGSTILTESIPHSEPKSDSSQMVDEYCHRIILENAHGKTTQVVEAPRKAIPSFPNKESA